MCTFSYGHLFLVSIFYQLNQVYTGDLIHCNWTLQLNKFYLIKNMKGNRGNWLAQFKFPLSILWSFLLPWGKVYSFPHFTVFICLLSLQSQLFVDRNKRDGKFYSIVANKCKEHVKCVRLLRAIVCKNQTNSFFSGKGEKFDFFLILILDRLDYN